MHAIKNYFLEFPPKLFRMYQRKDETEIWTFGFFVFFGESIDIKNEIQVKKFWAWLNLEE